LIKTPTISLKTLEAPGGAPVGEVLTVMGEQLVVAMSHVSQSSMLDHGGMEQAELVMAN
jgi:hypothetical protein